MLFLRFFKYYVKIEKIMTAKKRRSGGKSVFDTGREVNYEKEKMDGTGNDARGDVFSSMRQFGNIGDGDCPNDEYRIGFADRDSGFFEK